MALPLQVKSWKSGLQGRFYEGLLLILLLCVIGWGIRMNTPRFLLDLAGAWQTSHAEPAPQMQSFPARQDHEVEFHREFVTPEACLGNSCKLIVAQLGDIAVVTLNDVALQRPSTFDTISIAERRGPLGLDLPPALLRSDGGFNRLSIKLRGFNRQHAPTMPQPVGIANYQEGAEYLHWRAFRDHFLPLAVSLLAAAAVFGLACLSIGTTEHRRQSSLQRYAVANTLLMASFTRFYQLTLPAPLVLGLHFLLRFFADYALLLFWQHETGPKVRFWRPLRLLYCVGFVSLIVAGGVGATADHFGRHLDITGFIRTFLFYFYPTVNLGVLVVALLALKRRQWVSGIGYLAFVLIGTHDFLLGYRYIHGFFLTQYVHLGATLGCLFALLRRAATAQAQEKATRRAEQALVHLAQQMDHDIRSPLAALDIAAKELNASGDEDSSDSVRTIIHAAVERIREIADTLRTSRLETRGLAPLQLRELVEKIVTEKRMQFSRDSKLRLDVEANGNEETVACSGAPLKRVVSNLLNNAVEAMHGQGSIRVAVHGDKQRAYISITDSGPGMPNEVMARLGERGATHGKAGGSGLGIYHAMKTVREMHGDVQFDSPDEGGTRVVISLPRATPSRLSSRSASQDTSSSRRLSV